MVFFQHYARFSRGKASAECATHWTEFVLVLAVSTITFGGHADYRPGGVRVRTWQDAMATACCETQQPQR